MLDPKLKEAKRSYRRIAKKIFESESLKSGSDSRLINAIKPSSRDFVHETGKIRLEDIDGLGPTREKKIAFIGIWDIDDLYEEYEKGHLKELLGIQKDDNAFTPAVIARAIATSPKMPEENIGRGKVKIITPDGTIEELTEGFFFDAFKKQVKKESLTKKEEKYLKLITEDQEAELIDKFKKSNSVEGIQKALEDEKTEMKTSDIHPFAVKDESGKLVGRRIDEIKDYLSYFGVDNTRDTILTLEDRGNYLAQELIKSFAMAGEEIAPVVRMAREEISPLGRTEKIEKQILKFVLSDNRPNKSNIKELMKRGTNSKKTGAWDKLDVDADELTKTAMGMIKRGILKTDSIVADVPQTELKPTDSTIKEKIMERRDVRIGMTSNPRIPDYLDYIVRFPRESGKSYNERLLKMAGKVVFENKPITRDTVNLKLPIRASDDDGAEVFEDDLNKAIEILGISIKHGFAPLGYEYKKPEVATRYNTFNVLIRPPKELVNKVYKADDLDTSGEYFTFQFKKPSSFVADLGLTNLLKGDEMYMASVCLPTRNSDKHKRLKATVKSMAFGLDAIRPKAIKGITEEEDGVMTSMCKYAKEIKPSGAIKGKAWKFGDCMGWKEQNVATKILDVLTSPEFDKVKTTNYGKKLKTLSTEYGDILRDTAKLEDQVQQIEDGIIEEEKSGKYSAQRRIGCNYTHYTESPEAVVMQIKKTSEAGQELQEHLSRVCPDMDKVCILENVKFHQNMTENLAGSSLQPLNKKVYAVNPQSTNDKLIDEALVFIRNNAFGTTETIKGGLLEQRRAINELMEGRKHPLDLGKWTFLEKL